MFRDHDREFLQKALSLARAARNPPKTLGQKLEPTWAAVLATGERELVSEVFHPGDGTDAVEALYRKFQSLNYNLGVVTLYLTVEPRARFERLPPVTESIRKLGVRRVVYGTLDPSPRRQGEGVGILKQLGVEVVEANGEEARFCQLFLEDFAKAAQKGLPLVFAAGDFSGSRFQLQENREKRADAVILDSAGSGLGSEASAPWSVFFDGGKHTGDKNIYYRAGASSSATERELKWVAGDVDAVQLLKDLCALGCLSVEVRSEKFLERALRFGLVDFLYLPERADVSALRSQKIAFSSGASFAITRVAHDEDSRMLEARLGPIAPGL